MHIDGLCYSNPYVSGIGGFFPSLTSRKKPQILSVGVTVLKRWDGMGCPKGSFRGSDASGRSFFLVGSWSVV